MQLRITPTCLTVHELATVYDYAWNNDVSVESCDFLDNPAFLRIGVLPQAQRKQALENLQSWIACHPTPVMDQIVNTRHRSLAKPQIIQDASSYLNYIESAKDETSRLPDLVLYLKKLEHNRNNSILTYIPQYEHLFRSAGY